MSSPTETHGDEIEASTSAAAESTTVMQPQIPTFEDFLNGIKLGACRDKLVSAGLDEEMFGEFVQCEESFIDEAIREYPLNITQKVVFKNAQEITRFRTPCEA
ncbi:hypothetical protein BC936DRAFT_139905 [Jimgerdemannia flammicorona]|uniref:Uncharacterized protein n=1 Tax=Jimgerdemannia flammicorona TaxID=994334 RepID=A0A433B8Y9_9FUNG|nr:hypothetical protein BC936DRAFT_139905 [Jimgerdemannia flammicorona]